MNLEQKIVWIQKEISKDQVGYLWILFVASFPQSNGGYEDPDALKWNEP